MKAIKIFKIKGNTSNLDNTDKFIIEVDDDKGTDVEVKEIIAHSYLSKLNLSTLEKIDVKTWLACFKL